MFIDKKIKLILVDDNKDFVEALKTMISRLNGFSVIGVAGNGIDLLNHPLLSVADLILMDCEMPLLNGIETARHVNLQWPYKKLIALTMFDEKLNLLELLGAGFNGYIYKPDVCLKFESVINRVLNDEYVFDLKIIRETRNCNS
jgi:DNA-binding NarL/FixJ family response regulator